MVAEANPEAEGPRRKLTRLQVRLKDGRVLERTQEGPRGSPLDPMSPEELRERFRNSCASVLSPQRQEQVLAMVDKMEDVDDVKELPSLLVAG
jgi:2-methylcitrate dehydratase PrpD